ncbi:MAG: SMC-Scp complex subunit ScpB [Bryobacteraceae bacterium]
MSELEPEQIEESTFTSEQLGIEQAPEGESPDARLKAILEAIIYVTDEPLGAQQMAAAVSAPLDRVQKMLDELTAEYARPERGLTIREIAGGYKMATKPEHHDEIRAFVKNLKPALKLSLAALETLAVIAYKQPVTAPEIMEVRGVQGAGVLKTLLDRKLIAVSGRKNVIGKPILYKTTKDFLLQFGLKDVNELPTLKEFEEIGRMAVADSELVEEMPAPDAPADPLEAELAANAEILEKTEELEAAKAEAEAEEALPAEEKPEASNA